MIDGLRLDVTADELVKMIDVRIVQHTDNALADETNAKQIEETNRADDEDEVWDDDATASARLRRRAVRERERADALSFMRNHLVRGETYRLSTDDLRTLEIVQGRFY
jgi:hypothetical protein